MEERNIRDDEMEIDLKELFFVLLHKIWILILATVIGAGLVGGYTVLFMKPVYQSTSEVYIIGDSMDLSALANLQVGSQLTLDYMELIKSRPVVDKVIDELKLDMEYKTFVSNMKISNPTNTRILYITVSNHDAYMAKTIVDKLTDVSIAFIADKMETDEPNVVDYGHIAENKSSPSTTKNTLIGAVIGFVLAAGIIIVLHLMNDTVKTSDDVEKYLGIETLGVIPLDGKISKRKTRGTEKKSKKSAA
ncbi:MAG: polysaccharide export protein [Eubacterium sp.]|nr:polysaccharide export protein [Eubacterium sp.]